MCLYRRTFGPSRARGQRGWDLGVAVGLQVIGCVVGQGSTSRGVLLYPLCMETRTEAVNTPPHPHTYSTKHTHAYVNKHTGTHTYTPHTLTQACTISQNLFAHKYRQTSRQVHKHHPHNLLEPKPTCSLAQQHKRRAT